MKITHLLQKAQSQLLDIKLLIQAEGWDGKDPDWVSRDKGRFSSKNGATKDTSGKYLSSETQSQFQELSKDQKDTAKNAVSLPVFADFKSSMEDRLSKFSTESAKVYNKCIKDVGNAVDPRKIAASIEKTKKYYEDNPIQIALDGAKLALEVGTGVALLSCLYCSYGSIVLASALASGTSGFTPEALAFSLAVYGNAAVTSGVKTMINAISLAIVSAIDKQSEMDIKQRELITNLNKQFEDSRKTFPDLISRQYLQSIK